MAKEIQEERMWCGHCGVYRRLRRQGNDGSVKACEVCGKVLADDSGTAEEYDLLFRLIQIQASNRRRNQRSKTTQLNSD